MKKILIVLFLFSSISYAFDRTIEFKKAQRWVTFLSQDVNEGATDAEAFLSVIYAITGTTPSLKWQPTEDALKKYSKNKFVQYTNAYCSKTWGNKYLFKTPALQFFEIALHDIQSLSPTDTAAIDSIIKKVNDNKYLYLWANVPASNSRGAPIHLWGSLMLCQGDKRLNPVKKKGVFFIFDLDSIDTNQDAKIYIKDDLGKEYNDSIYFTRMR